MATASSPAAAPSRVARLLPAAATIVGVALLLRLVYGPWYLNYDARYALLWARDLVRGVTPEYTADFAPTPHPLETAVSVLATPFGDGGDRIMLWLILLSFGLLVWLTYRLGAVLFSHWVGVVAALVVLTRPALARDALLGYQDTAFACVIVGAVLLEARRARRGEAVLGLLVLAGLMRPEAWVLAGLYFLWMWPAIGHARRLRLAAMVAAAPLIWALSDLLVTGDALHSLHGTADLAEAVDRRRDVLDAPYWTAQYYGYTLREPLVIGIPIGLYFAWRQRYRAAILPLVVVAAMTLVFMAGPIFGLPLIGRYVRTPSVLLAAVLRARRVRLPPAGRPGRAPALDGDRDRHGGALGRLPAVALRHARRPRAAARPRRADVRGAADRGARAGGADGRRALRRAHLGLRLPAAAAPALLARDRSGERRDDAAGRQPARRRAAPAAPRPAHAALLPGELPADRHAAGLPRDLPQRGLARPRRAGLRQTSSSVTASWSTSRNSV